MIIERAWEDLKNARFSFFPAAGTGAAFLNPFPNRTPYSYIEVHKTGLSRCGRSLLPVRLWPSLNYEFVFLAGRKKKKN